MRMPTDFSAGIFFRSMGVAFLQILVNFAWISGNQDSGPYFLK